MATLSANGTELIRMEVTRKLLSSGTPYRETRVLMSNGKILKKVDFLGEYKHSTGWKVFSGIKLYNDAADFEQQLSKIGFTKV